MKKSVLAATPSREAAAQLNEILASDYQLVVQPGTDLHAALEAFRGRRHEFTFLDIACLDNNGPLQTTADFKAALQPFWQAFPSAHLIIITPWERTREAVSAVKAGAASYLCYPFDEREVELVLDSMVGQTKMEWELAHFRRGAVGEAPSDGSVTKSGLMREALEKAKAVAPTKTTVLLAGETGSGKGVMAKLIHAYSHRAKGPYIDVHCGAIPDTLLESEFFGHEKGAFTGAVRRKPGKFQIADGGTLFLDEIGTITPAAQIKMLQVLQEKSFTRVGGEELTQVDVRLIAATNCDLKETLRPGPVPGGPLLPPQRLSHRNSAVCASGSEDIPLLAATFIEKLNRENSKDIKGVDPARPCRALTRYSWPGNVRELENLIERAYILERGPCAFHVRTLSRPNCSLWNPVETGPPGATAWWVWTRPAESRCLSSLKGGTCAKS